MATSQKTFEHTATGVLGDKRSGMLSNELHLRSQLARTKKHGYSSYPGETYRYGLPYPEKDCGVAESLQWRDGAPSADSQDKKARKSTKGGKPRPKTFSSNMVFGMPARPSTPINGVLEFKYQDDWIEQQRRIQDAKTQKTQAKKAPPGSFRENRTSSLRQSLLMTSDDNGPLWTMPKFANAQRHLDTFRSDAERERAYKNHMSMVECS